MSSIKAAVSPLSMRSLSISFIIACNVAGKFVRLASNDCLWTSEHVRTASSGVVYILSPDRNTALLRHPVFDVHGSICRDQECWVFIGTYCIVVYMQD